MVELPEPHHCQHPNEVILLICDASSVPMYLGDPEVRSDPFKTSSRRKELAVTLT